MESIKKLDIYTKMWFIGTTIMWSTVFINIFIAYIVGMPFAIICYILGWKWHLMEKEYYKSDGIINES